MTHSEFEMMVILDIIKQYPEYEEKLKKQLSIARVKEREITKRGLPNLVVVRVSGNPAKVKKSDFIASVQVI